MAPCPTGNSVWSPRSTRGAFAALANLVGDANGDGKADLLYTYLDRQNSVQVQPLTSDGKIPDLVRQITNALGGVISITYSTLSNPAVYRPGAPAAYPNASARRHVAIYRRHSSRRRR